MRRQAIFSRVENYTLIEKKEEMSQNKKTRKQKKKKRREKKHVVKTKSDWMQV